MLSVKQGGIMYYFLSLAITGPGIDPSLPGHWRTLHPLTRGIRMQLNQNQKTKKKNKQKQNRKLCGKKNPDNYTIEMISRNTRFVNKLLINNYSKKN